METPTSCATNSCAVPQKPGIIFLNDKPSMHEAYEMGKKV